MGLIIRMNHNAMPPAIQRKILIYKFNSLLP